MSGMFFEYPGVRFSGQISLWQIVMRTFASLLVRPFAQAARQFFRMLSRPQPAEFSAATHIAFQRPGPALRGSRAADGASIDALRPNYNSVNTEDLYGISIIREIAAPTRRRRFPTEGRRSSLPAENNNPQSAGSEIALGQNHGIFRWWKSTDSARAYTAAQQRQQQQQRFAQRRKFAPLVAAA